METLLLLIELAKKLGPDFAAKLLDLALDPSFNEALGPDAGLKVTPAVFNSIDPEGHWKVNEWGYNHDRTFTNGLLADKKGELLKDMKGRSKASPGEAPIVRRSSQQTGFGAATNPCFANLLTIRVPEPPKSFDIWTSILDLIAPGAGSTGGQLAKLTILQEGFAAIDATWETDELEIWGGFAGLDSAWGFSSVFGHRASVEVLAIPYGNYLPGAVMVTMSGNVNPVGPKYVEFKCAGIIRAGKGPGVFYPLWGKQWERDKSSKQADIPVDPVLGSFKLAIDPY